MTSIREYMQYGISKERFNKILTEMRKEDYNNLLEMANKVDSYYAKGLVESILDNTSYDRIAMKYGYYGDKSTFYRRRRQIFHEMDKKMRKEGR